jgi:hypothetical protein
MRPVEEVAIVVDRDRIVGIEALPHTVVKVDGAADVIEQPHLVPVRRETLAEALAGAVPDVEEVIALRRLLPNVVRG